MECSDGFVVIFESYGARQVYVQQILQGALLAAALNLPPGQSASRSRRNEARNQTGDVHVNGTVNNIVVVT
jgi:hypothetical protein